MNLPRSTFCINAGEEEKDPAIDGIKSTTGTCRGYGYWRVTAGLRHRGMVVNAGKIRRIMRQSGLNPTRKRRYVATTDSDHGSPIYPNVAKDYCVHGPDPLWVEDITYIAIATGFACPLLSGYVRSGLKDAHVSVPQSGHTMADRRSNSGISVRRHVARSA